MEEIGLYTLISSAMNLLLGGGLIVSLSTLRSQQEKAKEEAKKAAEETKKAKEESKSLSIENDRKVSELVNEFFVEPLKKEMTSLRKQMTRLTHAIEKIQLCPHSADCPVKEELDKTKNNDI